MNNSPTDTCRKEFEKWKKGLYRLTYELDYEAWQAAWNASTTPLAEKLQQALKEIEILPNGEVRAIKQESNEAAGVVAPITEGYPALDRMAKAGYTQAMINLDPDFPTPFPWENESEQIKENWRRIVLAILDAKSE